MAEIESTDPVIITPDESLPVKLPVNTLNGADLPTVQGDRVVDLIYDDTSEDYDVETGEIVLD